MICGDLQQPRPRPRRRDPAIPVLLAAIAAALAVACAAAAGPVPPASTSALAVLVGLAPSEAAARLATVQGFVIRAVHPRQEIAIYGLGVGEGHAELFLGTAPDTTRPPLPREPTCPPNPTSLVKKLCDLGHSQWQTKVDGILAGWQGKRMHHARAWAEGTTGGLLNVKTRSIHQPLTTSDLSVGLFRASAFFTRPGSAAKALLVLTDQMPPPPDTQVRYDGLEGAHIILVGWRTDQPGTFRRRALLWTGFFRAEGADPKVVLIPRGLDSAERISAAVVAALSEQAN